MMLDPIISAVKDVSLVGSSPIIFGIAFAAAVMLIIRHEYIRVLILGLSLGSGLYSSLLKSLFKEGRPAGYISDGFIQWDRLLSSEAYSFPSTHTVLYTAFFGYLFYLTYQIKGVDKVGKQGVRIFCALLIVLVGISRVLLGAHYVIDVVFGYVFGLGYLGAIIAIETLVKHIDLRHKDQ
jgi:undecaprenyl-diphosphatase